MNEYSIDLDHGSVFLMWGSFNREYMHCVPPMKEKSDLPRLLRSQEATQRSEVRHDASAKQWLRSVSSRRLRNTQGFALL
eukprot:46561-Eustigmatos_ZCMA.PRE.1